MNCDLCKQQMSGFLDGELDQPGSAAVRAHLAACEDCSAVCAELAMILDSCIDDDAAHYESPNSNALWCRINNSIESELTTTARTEVHKEGPPRGWFARLRDNELQISFSQTITAVLGVALISSLLTVVGLRNFRTATEEPAVSTTVSDTIFEKILGKFGLIETPQQARARRLDEQQKAIDYWNDKVEQRRKSWNAKLRETFDRNLNEINQVVFEYNRILEKDPQDALTGEMLDSAMREKMELLREFSEL